MGTITVEKRKVAIRKGVLGIVKSVLAFIAALVTFLVILTFVMLPLVAFAFVFGGFWHGVAVSLLGIPPTYFFIKCLIRELF